MEHNQILDFIDSDELVELAEKIGRNFKLHIDQENILYSLIQIFLRGEISPESFVKRVGKELEIDERLAKLVIQAVDEEVLKPLKKRLVVGDSESDSIIENINKSEVEMATLDKQHILDEIENPTPTTSRIIGHILSSDTPKETADKIIEEALTEATAHEFKNSEQPTVPTKPAADTQHRIESHERHVVFLPTEHVSINAQNIIASVEEQPVAKVTTAAPEIKTTEQKKRPLSDIIPPNTPRKYSVDPYREPTN